MLRRAKILTALGIPLNLGGIECLFSWVEIFSHRRQPTRARAIVDVDHRDDTLHRQCSGAVVRLHLTAEDRRGGERSNQQTFSGNIGTIVSAAINFGRRVFAREIFANEFPGCGVFQFRLGWNRQLGRSRSNSTERHAALRRVVINFAVFSAALVGLHTPLLRGSRHQHFSALGAGAYSLRRGGALRGGRPRCAPDVPQMTQRSLCALGPRLPLARHRLGDHAESPPSKTT